MSDEQGKAIDFYYDFSSPYGYIAAQKIDDIASLYNRKVNWKPILLGIIFKTTGAQPLVDIPLKGAYSKRDMERMIRFYGLNMNWPETFPFPSIAAARAVYWAEDQQEGGAAKLTKALYHKAFGEGGDIRDPGSVLEVAGAAGFDTNALSAGLQDPEVKERLKTEVEAAMEAGVCGSPFFIVDGEPFWGADRLDHVERWLATGGW